MSHPDRDTIYALASGSGRSAIAVIRIAGRDSARVASALCALPAPRRAALRILRDAAGAVLDQAVVIWQPGPSSYTGEDGAELHVHGGIAVIRAVSESLNAAGARPAEPGEFTKRAFLNGRIDLLGAEAVADLVDAETESQRRQALRQLDGELGGVVQGWSARLQRLLAYQEALIDFADENLPGETEALVVAELTSLRDEIDAHLSDDRVGARLRDGMTIAVVGPPNVGKSSLVNALAERDVSIVSPIAGTTRDALETRLDIGGVLVTLIDTAGIRDSDDPVEIEGVRRARGRAAAADLLVSVSDPTISGWTGERPAGSVIQVLNKADLESEPIEGRLAVSALTGAGVADLRACLASEARRLAEHAGVPPLTRERHRSALLETARLLSSACSATLSELRSEDIRQALRALGRLRGWVGVEDVLDVVFREFCIGK